MDSQLLDKVLKGKERIAGIKTLLILTVAALDLAAVTWRVRPNQLVPDTQFSVGFLEQHRQIALTVRETVGGLKPIVYLNTLHLDTFAGVPRPQFAQKVCRRGIGGLLRIPVWFTPLR